jgi:diamine N-acetyltransferase
MTKINLLDVDGDNWRDVANVKVKPGQEEFVAATAYYMCLAHYGDDWHPLAIEADGEIVGHVMWAVDEEEDSIWLGGLVIDGAKQGRGIGRAAVQAFLDRFGPGPGAHIALSYAPDNTVARRLYQKLGFVETGEMADDEVVARYRP